MYSYIVYLTTNLINKKIYIGVHKQYIDPYKFDGYLGNSVYATQPSTYMNPKEYFQKAVKKYGPKNFVRITLRAFDNEQDALDLERWLVNEDFINRKDTYNVALGGGIPPAITKTIYQYSLEGEFLQEYNSITEASLKLKCAQSCIGRAVLDGTPALGYLWSDFKEDHLKLTELKIDRNKKVTYLYDSSGEYVSEFKSLTECAKYLNTPVNTCGKAVSGKFKVRECYLSFKKFDKFPIPMVNHIKGNPIYQYDLEGNFVKEWANYGEIKEFFKKDINIFESLRLKTVCHGFQWSTEKLSHMRNMKKNPLKTQKRKVGKYTLDGELIQVFESVRKAKEDTCGAPSVLRGNRKTAGGYLWKYID